MENPTTATTPAPAPTIAEIIGANMRTRREQLGWTQNQFSRHAEQWVGTVWTRQAVFAAEHGNRAFTAGDVAAIAVALRTTPATLFAPPPGTDTVTLPGGPAAADRLTDQTEYTAELVLSLSTIRDLATNALANQRKAT